MPREARRVSVIPERQEYTRSYEQENQRKKRVAAYCRVSTEQEQQQTSYEAQVEYYTQYIKSNPDWEFAGIYADDGITGTNLDRRDNFNRLINDSRRGKIDMILSKSVSRFARNTVDSIVTIRELKAIGVAVYFETERINTLESQGEMLIAVLSSQAQEESHSISTNVTWGFRRKFEKGEISLNYKHFMGITKDIHGNYVIDEKEAAIVRSIFYWYLRGDSCEKIKCKLEERGVKTATGKENWNVTTILRMISNEKYMGDALLQKTYTEDYLTHKRKQNVGQRKQYYVENAIPAIIPRSIFYMVQQERAKRARLKGAYSSRYALTEIVVCAECGSRYRRTTWSNPKRKQEKRVVWRCINRLKNGTKYCKDSPTVPEEALHTAIMKGLSEILYGDDDLHFKEELKQDILNTMADLTGGTTPEEIDLTICNLQEELLRYAGLAAKEDMNSRKYDDKFRLIAKQIEQLKEQKCDLEKLSEKKKEHEGQIAEIDKFMKGIKQTDEYDDVLVRQLVREIRIISKNRAEMELNSGMMMSLTL